MKALSRILTCISLLVIVHFRYLSAQGDRIYDTAIQNNQVHVSRLGESPIGPAYRQRRDDDQANEIENDTASPEEDDPENTTSNNGDTDDEDGSDEDNNENNEDDDDKKDEDEDRDSDPQINENLNLLKTTRKSLRRYKANGGHLDKLMSESSELAKEVGAVFHAIAKREAGLEQEMESLKEALNGAVVTLKNTIKEEELMKSKNPSENKVNSHEEKSTVTRLRRDQKNPYRACVSIEPNNQWKTELETQQSLWMMANDDNGPEPAEVSVREYMPSREQLKDYNRLQKLKSSSSSFQPDNYPAVAAGPSQNKALEQNAPSNYPPAPSQPRPQVSPPISRPLSMIPLQELQQQQTSYSQQNQQIPPQQPQERQTSYSQQARQIPPPPPPPSVNQYGKNGNNLQTNPSVPNGMNDVDLSEVYWLRLDPNRKQPQLHSKIDKLLEQKQDQGKDVLVIPVSHDFQNTAQVKDGFLRAVRVRPTALKHRAFRKLRSLHIMEM